VTENTAQSADWQRRQYRMLLGLSKAIATHRNLSDLLHDLAGHLRDLVDLRCLGITLHDGSRRVMRVHILETSEPAVWQFPSEIPIEWSIAGWVWQHQQPFVTRDVQQETRFPTTFTEGCEIGDVDILVDLSGEVGLDMAAAREVLDTGRYLQAVVDDEDQAQALSVSGVPFIVINGKYAISGAQSGSGLKKTLETVWREEHPLQMLTDGDSPGVCGPDGCPI
jgi:hypothetical protein